MGWTPTTVNECSKQLEGAPVFNPASDFLYIHGKTQIYC